MLSSLTGQGQTFDLTATRLDSGDVYCPRPNVYFEFDKPTIRPKSFPMLDSLSDFLRQFPNVIIEINTHTDSRYSEYYSRRLDQSRSESVKEYLVDQGVPENQLIAQGRGKSNPLVTDAEIEQMKTDQEKEEAHARNRRVEFKILATIDQE